MVQETYNAQRNEEMKKGPWRNGSVRVSKTLGPGSNPGGPA